MSEQMPAAKVVTDNAEVREAWNGPLFDRWIAFREIVTVGLSNHGERALAALPPRPGDRVLDIGCGLGDTTQRIAGLVGPDGHAHGVDVAPRMIELAIAEAQQAEISSISFAVADVQDAEFDQTFDYAFSRMGTMFFANPVAALRNVGTALAPGSPLNMVVWRRKIDNDWLHRAELVVEDYLDQPEETDEPTCGPGPFSMADADAVTEVLVQAGFEQISLERSDLPIEIGSDLDQAVELVMAIGPAGEVIRLAGEGAAEIRPTIEAKLREALADFVAGNGTVVAPASTWIISARAG